jgi:hypothetical protein
MKQQLQVALIVLTLSGVVCAQSSANAYTTPNPGSRGAPGLALRTTKALLATWEGPQVLDNATLLVKDGKIVGVGPSAEISVPDGYVIEDVGKNWLMPGMLDLHTHVAGNFDINDMVLLANPDLRVKSTVVPNNVAMRRSLASGVTSCLYIPGSGTNIGGQGLLLKTGVERYEDAVIRDPGSLKVAQWGNPESWTVGIGMAFENWNTRNTLQRGMAYARLRKAGEDGSGPKVERNIQWDVFPDLLSKRVQVSTHTQVYQVVLMTITMIKEELGIDVYIDHGEFQGFRAAEKAQAAGVPAILGPRNFDRSYRGFVGMDTDGKWLGIAAEYQKRGHKQIGFNTDAPVIPAEELFLQASIAVRYGFESENMDTVRGLTIVPAKTAGVDNRIGSLEVGKDADIVVISGDPADPRSHVIKVLIEGQRTYDVAVEGQRF